MKSRDRCQWMIKESSRVCGKVGKQRIYGKSYCQRHHDIIRVMNPIVKAFNQIQETLAKQKPKRVVTKFKVDEDFY